MSILERWKQANEPEPELDYVDIVLRALALRKLRKIGALWADEGRFWVSTSEYDPYGSRFRVSLEELAAIVAAVEGGSAIPEKLPVQRETRATVIVKKGVSA